MAKKKDGQEELENTPTEVQEEELDTEEEVEVEENEEEETAPTNTPTDDTPENEEETDEEDVPEGEDSDEEPSSDENLSISKSSLEAFGTEISAEDLVQLAKEGLENRNEVISEALKHGVRSMGNAFNKEVFNKTFESMKTKEIKEMSKAWETQADNQFVKEKVSKQSYKQEDDEEINLDYTQFKTGLY